MKAIFFCFGYICLYGTIVAVKKSEKKQRLFVWLMMTFIIIMCYQALMAGILNIIKIPINLYSIGICDIVLGFFLGRRAFIKKEIQKYEINVYDFVAGIILLIPTIFAGFHQFGPELNINYMSADGATHFRLALEILENQSVSGMYFASVNNALFLGVVSIWTKMTQLFHYYVLLDVIMFYMSGTIFYCIISDKINSRKLWLAGVIISFFYMMGYPQNNMLYGFGYLGISVLLISFILWTIKYYIEKTLYKNWAWILLSLGCFSVGICYSLFAPVVFLAVFSVIAVEYWKKGVKAKNIKDFIVDCIKVFLIPCILIVIYSLLGFFGTENIGGTISSGISNEGGIYRDLFSNFVFWIPFALFGVCHLWKKKTNDLAPFCFVFLLLFTAVLGYGVIIEKVSTYYFYKNYFFFSLIIFYLAYVGIKELMLKSQEYIWMSAVVFCGLAIISAFGIEEKIQGKNFLLAPTLKSQYYFDIYNTNWQLTQTRGDYSADKIALYEYCYDNFPKNKYETIIIYSSLEDQNIFRAIALYLSEENYIFWKRETTDADGDSVEKSFKNYAAQMGDIENEIPILCVFKSEDEKEMLQQIEGINLKVLYENGEGFVAMLSE